jgi:predicted nuclease of predicted toxin-antitoxin system
VSLDADFADMATLRGAPPKIIWLRCGNQPTAFVEHLLRNNAALIANFAATSDAACLELY